MGINLNDFATGAEQIKPSEGGADRPEDGTYEYEVTKIDIFTAQDGRKSIYIDYRLDNGQSYREWFGLPAVYGQETDKERQAIARYLRRLVDLGVPRETVNSFTDTDSLIGWRGTFQLVSTKTSQGKTYQNIRNLKPSQGSGDATQQQLAGQPPRVDAAMIPAPTAAPAATATTPADDDNPFGGM